MKGRDIIKSIVDKNLLDEEFNFDVDVSEKIKQGLQMQPEEIIANRDDSNFVEGYVEMNLFDMVGVDDDDILNEISTKLVGSDLLFDIVYEVVAVGEKNNLILKVTGDASYVIET